MILQKKCIEKSGNILLGFDPSITGKTGYIYKVFIYFFQSKNGT